MIDEKKKSLANIKNKKQITFEIKKQIKKGGKLSFKLYKNYFFYLIKKRKIKQAYEMLRKNKNLVNAKD